MAQLSSNSQGTLGIDGGGTQSSLMSILNAVGYMGLMTTAIKEANKNKGKEKDDDSEDSNNADTGEGHNSQEEPSDVEVEWRYEDQNRIEGRTQESLTGRDPRRLKPSPPSGQKGEPLTEREAIGISAKEDLTVAIQVGNHYIEDKYSNLPVRFSEMSREEKQTLEIAMTGGVPSKDVSIKVEDEFGRQSKFSANREENEGWQVIGEPSEHLSARAMQHELSRQQGSGPRKIKEVMKEISSEDGPQIFSEGNLVIFTDSDEVVVFDKERGIVRDVDRLDTIGNQGQQAVREAAREAAGKFRISDAASKGIGSTSKAHKQRQLTP